VLGLLLLLLVLRLKLRYGDDEDGPDAWCGALERGDRERDEAALPWRPAVPVLGGAVF